MKKLILIILALCSFTIAKSQSVNDYVNVTMKNGYIIKGVLLENIPNSYIKIRLNNNEISEINYSDIKDISINQIENDKIIKAEQEKNQRLIEAENLRKQDEENKENLRKQDEEKKRQEIIQEAEKKRKDELRFKEIKDLTSKDYIFIGGGVGKSFWGGKGFDNLVNTYKYISPIAHSSSISFNSYDLFAEYHKNISTKKNIFIAIEFKNYNSMFTSNELNLNFNYYNYSLNVGHCFYQNRFFQSGIGTGFSYTQSNVVTNVENRTNVLCGKTTFYSIPIFLNMRSAFLLNKIPAFFYLKPSVDVNFLSSNTTTNLSLTAGIGFFLKK